jgi:hypothetical protein
MGTKFWLLQILPVVHSTHVVKFNCSVESGVKVIRKEEVKYSAKFHLCFYAAIKDLFSNVDNVLLCKVCGKSTDVLQRSQVT